MGKERRKGCGKACRSSGRRWHLSFGSEESVRKGTFKRTTGRLDFGMTWPGNKQTTVGNGYVSKNGRMRNPRRGTLLSSGSEKRRHYWEEGVYRMLMN